MTMKLINVLHSEQDASVNFLYDWGVEARYVERDDYIIIYVSSSTGCNLACRMCHLTQSKQTETTHLQSFQVFQQVMDVLAYYRTLRDASKVKHMTTVHINYMARGDLLDNAKLTYYFSGDSETIRGMGLAAGFEEVRFNISTIFPKEGERVQQINKLICLTSVRSPVTIFYSLYSMQYDFRKRWLPKAEDPEAALELLRKWQIAATKSGPHNVVIHHPLIEGENDSELDAHQIVEAVNRHEVRARFNLVRYNSYSPAQGKETTDDKITRYFAVMAMGMPIPGSRIVPRVGPDVRAACGMFIELNQQNGNKEIQAPD